MNKVETTPESNELLITWSELFNKNHLPKMLFLCSALWLHACNSMLVATTLPAAVDEIGGLHLINWAFSLYLTGSVVAGTAMGLFVGTYGLRKTMIAATLIYTVGCIVCALAGSMPVFLVGRIVQGVGGGALVALVYLTQDRFFPNRYIPKIVACLSAVWMLATFIGPLIGGLFATFGIWRFAFIAFAVQAIVLIFYVRRMLPSTDESSALTTKRLPVFQLALLAATITLTSLASANSNSILSPLYLLIAIGTFVAFVVVDKKSGSLRMLPVSITKLKSPVGAGFLMILMFSITLMSFLVYGPTILIKIFGMNPFTAGLVLMLEALAWGFAAIVFAGVSQTNETKLLRTGSCIIVIGLIINSWIVPHGPIWLLIPAVMLTNFGFGMMWGHIIRRIKACTDDQEKDRASSVLPVAQQIGFALGAALSGLIANNLGLSEDISISNLRIVAFWIFAGFVPIALLGSYFAWLFTTETSLH